MQGEIFLKFRGEEPRAQNEKVKVRRASPRPTPRLIAIFRKGPENILNASSHAYDEKNDHKNRRRVELMVDIISYPIPDKSAQYQPHAHAGEARDIDEFFFWVLFSVHLDNLNHSFRYACRPAYRSDSAGRKADKKYTLNIYKT